MKKYYLILNAIEILKKVENCADLKVKTFNMLRSAFLFFPVDYPWG